jgi:hypothetical protein
MYMYICTYVCASYSDLCPRSTGLMGFPCIMCRIDGKVNELNDRRVEVVDLLGSFEFEFAPHLPSSF